MREKLIEFICSVKYGNGSLVGKNFQKGFIEKIADHLIANGVTVQKFDGCLRCKDTSEMTVCISNKLVDGVKTGWLGGNLPAKYCPFCGRRLPQPPKGE